MAAPLVDPFVEPGLFTPQNGFEYGLWLGFGADKNAVVARLPDSGIPSSGFVTVGFLTDIGQPTVTAWHGYSTTSNLPYTKTVDDRPFVVDDSSYARWPIQIAITRVQASDADPTQPDGDLPRYWAVRGQVQSAIRSLTGSGDDWPSPVIYRGEPLWDTDANIYAQDHLDKPWEMTILDRDIYYPAATVPTPLASVVFSGFTNRVPATYASITPPSAALIGSGSTVKLPLWRVAYPYSYAFRHTMSANASRLY